MVTECGGPSDENLNKGPAKITGKTFTLSAETRCIYQRLARGNVFMSEMVLVRTLANAQSLIKL